MIKRKIWSSAGCILKLKKKSDRKEKVILHREQNKVEPSVISAEQLLERELIWIVQKEIA